MSDRTGLSRTLLWLYEGVGRTPAGFRWALLVFDIVTIAYFFVSPFLERQGSHPWLDYGIGTVIALDLAARFYITRRKGLFVTRPMNIADFVVVLSMFAPLVTQNLAFLRVIRAVRIARAFSFLRRESPVSRYLHLNRELLDRSVNLVVFVFIMSALVYATQYGRNDGIRSFLDAVYFTVTSLTTTGYGDILMQGTLGRVLNIVIMLLGITLFLRLLKALVAPSHKVRHECRACGLERHDRDAIHCKHCGTIVHIPTEGIRG